MRQILHGPHRCLTVHFPTLRRLLVPGILAMAALTAPSVWAAESGGTISPGRLSLVPWPRNIRAYAAKWHVPRVVRILARNAAERNTAHFALRFLRTRGIHGIMTSAGPAEIVLSTRAHNIKIGDEGYHLTVKGQGADFTANTGRGLFYALQTFEQLFNPAKPTDNAIHEASITDWPRYRWRGIMLDCSRHFFPVPVVEKFLRLAAHYKLNVFHWHLSDYQGWRIQIPQYPRLTHIGAWRSNISAASFPPAGTQGPRYGGFYTDAQVRHVVAYARHRGITVVPEIDMPGHCGAAIAAYPWLAGQKTIPPVGTPLCPSPRTFKFLHIVFGDLTTLFPGPFFHLGGDEVDLSAWKGNAIVTDLMQQRHWNSFEQVHNYFARNLADFLASKHRRAVVWNDVPARGLPQSTVVECYDNSSTAAQNARLGHDVIITSQGKLYFNFFQGNPKYESCGIATVDTLRDTYDFNPSSQLPASLHHRLLGAEGCLWTEMVSTSHALFYQILPRELALSEIAWTPLKEQNYADFVQRTAHQYLWLSAHGYPFFIPPPSFDFNAETGKSTATDHPNHTALDIETWSPTGWVHISDVVPGDRIYYTTDGTIPNNQSHRYDTALRVTLKPGHPVVIYSVAMEPSGQISAPSKLILQFSGGH